MPIPPFDKLQIDISQSLKKGGYQCNIDYTIAVCDATHQIIIRHKPEKKVPSITDIVQRYNHLLEQYNISASYIDQDGGDPYLMIYDWTPNQK